MASPREAVAIFELVVYAPLIAVTLFIAFRHGFIKQLGWIYLSIFCALRIVGAALEIVSNKNPNSVSDSKWAAIIGTIGLSPLLLAGFELLKTLNDFISPNSIRTRAIHLLHLPCLLALILSIIGGLRITSPTSSLHESGASLAKAGGIIFLVLYILHILLIFLTMLDLSDIPAAQKQIYLALLVATPALGVRILYTLMVDFGAGDVVFAFTGGNVYVKLGMATIMDVLIVAFYTAAGLRTTLAKKDRKSVEDGADGVSWRSEQSVPLRNVSPEDPLRNLSPEDFNRAKTPRGVTFAPEQSNSGSESNLVVGARS